MPKTLLLADDSVTIQKVVGISFANEDVELVTVDNGDDAVARARELRPDVILADVVMPGKNGYEVCEELRLDPLTRKIPVLLLTGTFEAYDEERAQRSGAAGHVSKPFEAQTLVQRVKELWAAAPLPAPPAADPMDPAESFDFLDEDLDAAPRPSQEATVALLGDREPLGAPPAAAEALSLDDALGLDEPLDGPTPRDPAGDSFDFDLDTPAPPTPEAATAPPVERDDLARATVLDPGGASGYDISASELEPVLGDPLSNPLAEGPASGDGAAGLAPLGSPLDAAEDDFDDPLAVSSLELGESDLEDLVGVEPVAALEASGPVAESHDPAGIAGVALAEITPRLREEIHETLEKIAWESLGEAAEQLVRQAVERVEQVAWEVIPQMAETLIREEIRRMKGEPPE